MKQCNECKILKSLSEFHKSKRHKDGYRYKCKKCQKKHQQKYYAKNRERILAERKQPGPERDRQLAYLSDWGQKNKRNRQQYYLDNRDRYRENQQKWRG